MIINYTRYSCIRDYAKCTGLRHGHINCHAQCLIGYFQGNSLVSRNLLLQPVLLIFCQPICFVCKTYCTYIAITTINNLCSYLKLLDCRLLLKVVIIPGHGTAWHSIFWNILTQYFLERNNCSTLVYM